MPRFGDLLSTDVWAAATRTLSDFSAEEIFDLPLLSTTYQAQLVTSAASVDGFGSWVQLSADIGAGKRLIGVYVTQAGGSSLQWEVEIGEGGSGSEAAVARVAGSFLVADNTGHRAPIYIPVWKSLTDNARISTRARDQRSDANELYVTGVYA